jgi:hypothetical protein
VTIAHNVFDGAGTALALDGACATGAAPTDLTFVNNVVRDATDAYVPTPDSWVHGNNCWQATTSPWPTGELAGPCELTSGALPPADTDFAPLSQSQLVGAGLAFSAVTTDRLCRPRSDTAPTVGVVE